MWLVGVVIRRYIDILIIIINFPYSTCIRSFFGRSILTSLFIFKCFFGLYIYINQHGYAIDSTRVVPCLQYYNYIAIYDSRDNNYVCMYGNVYNNNNVSLFESSYFPCSWNLRWSPAGVRRSCSYFSWRHSYCKQRLNSSYDNYNNNNNKYYYYFCV